MGRKSKYPVTILVVPFCILFILMGFASKSNQSQVQSNVGNKVTLGRSNDNNKTGSITKIEYTLDINKPILHLTSPAIKSIDIEALKKQIGKDNVGVDYSHQKLHLNLKDDINDKGKGSFELVTLDKQFMIIDFSDIENEQLLLTAINAEDENQLDNIENTTDEINRDDKQLDNNEDLNAQSKSDNDNRPLDQEEQTNRSDLTERDDDDDDDEDGEDSDDDVNEDPNIHEDEDNPLTGWRRSEKVLITPGHVKTNSDGSRNVPVLYFGAINYALEGLTIKKSVAGRPLRTGLVGILIKTPIGDGRMNNLTAANSSLIEVPKNGSMNTPQNNKKETNHFYTNTFGDGKLPPPPALGSGVYNAGDKVYRGSQRNFVTTNIYDYYNLKPNSNKDHDRPRMFGPDAKNSGKYTGLVKKQTRLYYKPYYDSKINKTTIMQRLIFYQKVDDYQIRVKITQRFDANNKVIINQEFTNVSTKYMDNFQGYTFRDITFMQDHTRKQSDQKQSLRSLGNHHGIYSMSSKYKGRIEVKLDGFEDSPYAWAGRDSRSTFFKADKDDKFPWSFNNNYNKPNAFENVDDLADKGVKDPGIGKTWIDESIKYDSSIAMHTKNQPLAPQETVSMSYSINAIPLKDKPDLKIKHSMTNEEPHVLKPADKSFKVSGTWRSNKNKFVDVKYLVRPLTDKIDEKDDVQDLKNNGVSATNGLAQQTDYDRENGIPQNWSTEVPLNKLQTGINEFYAIAIDKKGKISDIKRTYVSSQEPLEKLRIKIDTPKSDTTKDSPYEPRSNSDFVDKIDISGKSFSTYDNFEIRYNVDGNDEDQTIDSPPNVNSDGINEWMLKDFSLKPFMKDAKLHNIEFSIYSHEKGADNEDIVHVEKDLFWFKMGSKSETDGRLQIIAPKEIDFGIMNLPSNSEKNAKAHLNGNFFVDDYREDQKRTNPISISLITEDFISLDSKKTDEKLLTEVRWGTKKIEPTSKYNVSGNKLSNRIVLTDLIQENLNIQVRRNQNVRDGKFRSVFNWNATDSI